MIEVIYKNLNDYLARYSNPPKKPPFAMGGVDLHGAGQNYYVKSFYVVVDGNWYAHEKVLEFFDAGFDADMTFYDSIALLPDALRLMENAELSGMKVIPGTYRTSEILRLLLDDIPVEVIRSSFENDIDSELVGRLA